MPQASDYHTLQIRGHKLHGCGSQLECAPANKVGWVGDVHRRDDPNIIRRNNLLPCCNRSGGVRVCNEL
jgi:hypothetical protein